MTLVEALSRIASLGERMELPDVVSEARRLSERVAKESFHLVVLGQFKRGKSTLINALLEESILPVGVRPVTSILTLLRYGQRRIEVRFQKGAVLEISVSELAQYATEKENPENRKGVSLIQIWLPSPLLAAGICLVDTPGVGSVFPQNARLTHSFIPQVDAALAVLGADPPISGEELLLISEVSKETSDWIFVLNKADRMSPSDREEAKAFCREVLPHFQDPSTSFFEISAVNAIAETGEQLQWKELLSVIRSLCSKSRARLVDRAGKKGLKRLTSSILLSASEREKALRASDKEITDALFHLASIKTIIDIGSRTLGYGASYKLHHFSEWIKSQRNTLLAASSSLRAPDSLGGKLDPVQIAESIVEGRLSAWRKALETEAEHIYSELCSVLVERSRQTLREIAEAARLDKDTLPEISAPHWSSNSQHHSRRRQKLSTRLRLWLFKRIIKRGKKPAAVERYLKVYLEERSLQVSARIYDQLQTNFAAVAPGFRRDIEEVAGFAERAIHYSKNVRAKGADAISEARKTSEAAKIEVQEIQSSID